MDYSTLTGRLSIHLESIQEGFEELSTQNSLKGLAKQFALILSGNFVTTDVNIFFREHQENDWQEIHLKKEQCKEILGQLELHDSFHIYETKGAYPPMTIPMLMISTPTPRDSVK